MNIAQEEKLIEILTDFIIDSKDIRDSKKFIIKAYRNEGNTKIPVRFQLNNLPIAHVVIDYFKQEILKDCNGINDSGNFIRLNCDLVRLKELGYVNYFLDNNLTDKLNQYFAPK